MSNYISIKKIIDVSTSITPAAQTRRDMSSPIFIMIGVGFTTGTINSFNSANDVLTAYGSNSPAYLAALKFFAGGFNGIKPKTFYVGLVKTTDAVVSTRGYFTTGNISANLATLIATTNGEFKISVDEQDAVSILNIDLTSETTFNGVATALEKAINLAGINNVKVSYASNAFTFTSDSYGATSNVTITDAGGSGTDLLGANYFNGGTDTDGTTGTLATTIANFLSDNRYYHILLSNQFSEAQAKEWSSAVESATKITYLLWYQTSVDEIENTTLNTDTGTIALDFYNRKYKKTVLVFADDLTEYTHVAFVSYFATIDFTAARKLGSLTWKQFTGLMPSDLTDAQFDNLKSKNVNFYGVYGEVGRNIAYEGRVPSGNFINDIILADWLDYNQTYDIFDWAISKSKIAYTISDFAELSQKIENSLINAINFGAIAGGVDPDTGENLLYGYKILMPKPSNISSANKSAGIINNISVVALTSGNATKIVITNVLKA